LQGWFLGFVAPGFPGSGFPGSGAGLLPKWCLEQTQVCSVPASLNRFPGAGLTASVGHVLSNGESDLVDRSLAALSGRPDGERGEWSALEM